MRLIVFHYDFFQVGFDTRCSPWLAVWRYLKKSAVPIHNRLLIQPRANRDHMLESFFCLRRHRDRSHPLLCFGGFDEQFPGVIEQLMLNSHNISLEIHVIHSQPAEFTYAQPGLMSSRCFVNLLFSRQKSISLSYCSSVRIAFSFSSFGITLDSVNRKGFSAISLSSQADPNA